MGLLDFSLPNVVNDTWVSLPDPAGGTPVVIIFTCNHCPYAIAYESRIERLYHEFALKGVPLLAISSNDPQQYPQDGPDAMRLRAIHKGFSFPYLFDESQSVARNYSAQKTPHAFVIAPRPGGWTILYQGAIDDNYSDATAVGRRYLEEAVNQALNHPEAEPWSMPPVGCGIKWKRI